MSHRVFIICIFVFYMVFMTGIMVWQGIGIAPDRYALVLLLAALLVKRTRSFLLDWIPFLFILISYDFLRGFAENVTGRVDFQFLIDSDLKIFGFLPTVELQKLLFNPNNLHWYDYLASIFYFLHFSLPLSFGFIIWVFNKEKFRQFVTAICLLSYSAWLSYLLFPAAPPWLAQNEGYIKGVTKIMDLTTQAFPERFQLPTIYHQFNPNPVAAFPSMHAAYPMLILLFLVSLFKKKGLLFLPYVFAVWFSIIYLGEHYVIDVIGGIIYAVVFFMLAKQLHHNVKLHTWLRKITEQM